VNELNIRRHSSYRNYPNGGGNLLPLLVVFSVNFIKQSFHLSNCHVFYGPPAKWRRVPILKNAQGAANVRKSAARFTPSVRAVTAQS
jgi:hypothetical protein